MSNDALIVDMHKKPRNCNQVESNYLFTTENHHILIRGVYSATPIFFINNPERNSSRVAWDISENLRDLGLKVANRPNPEGVRDFLCYGFVPAPRTIFKDILAIPPGTVCRLPLAGGPVEWRPVQTARQAQGAQSETAFWRQICAHSRLQQSAVLLSGGLDSAMITAAALTTGTTIQTFHARFRSSAVTEDSDTHAARTTAQHFGIPYHEIAIGSWDALRWFGRAVNALPQPFADPVILPFYLLFRELNKVHIQHVLTGEGGDQLFGSWSMKPMLIRELYPEVNYSRDSGYLSSLHKFHDDWQDLMSASLIRQLPAGSKLESPITNAFATSPSSNICDQLRWVDLQLKGLQHILPRIEAMANAHQLQLHHPFFQEDMIESAMNLPSELKLAGTREKVLLKKLAASILPPEITERRKQGMGVPTSMWFRRDLRPLAIYWLNKHRLVKSGLLNPEYVRETVVNNKTVSDGRGRRWGDRLWQLCVLECWFAGLNVDRGMR